MSRPERPRPIVSSLRVRGFRSIRDLTLRPGPVAALVGEARAGKSNLIAAVRAVLDPRSAPLIRSDLPSEEGRVRIEAEMSDGTALVLDAAPGDGSQTPVVRSPTVFFLPASLRSGSLVAVGEHAHVEARDAGELLIRAIKELEDVPVTGDRDRSSTTGAQALVRSVESYRSAGLTGLVILVEEPELYLRPHAQRYLYRLLLDLSAAGNQVIYSTHAPAFLNVARLEELVFVRRHAQMGTTVVQPERLPEDEEFRAMSEFDAERSELFLSRVAVLVEGRTEKLSLPYVFRAMGHDIDREGISIVSCGGKPNVLLVAQVCRAAGVPFVAVHDRDAPPGRKPSAEERALNHTIATVAGPDRHVELAPDFEGVASLHGRRHKPERAWDRFRALDRADVPEPLVRIVRLTEHASSR